jgi:hypothetical protein
VPWIAHSDCLAARGYTHERSGSGLELAEVYRRNHGAPMLPKHAENKGGGYHTEPAIEEMIGYMKRGAFTIASHMSELGEEILNYHRDEDYKIVRLRDDLIAATRYAFMARRHGRTLNDCESYDRAPGIAGADAYDPRPYRVPRSDPPQRAKNIDFDLFTGKAFS